MHRLISVLLASLAAFSAPEEPGGPKSSIPAVRSAASDRGLRRYESLLTAPDRRLRAMDPRLEALIAEGVRRSHTFAVLLSDLDKTDVIVYVEQIRKLPPAIAGRLLLVPVTHGQRYLRIQLGTGGSTEDAISTLAHELQHAIEIGASPDVRDQNALARLYERIGEASVGAHTYDTVAARVTGRRVKLELMG